MAARIIRLSGLGEFGMNCCAVESGGDVIVIDSGLMFPDESAPGVDVVIPELEWLVENRAPVKAVLLTHAHEDHIGGLPHLLREVSVPVYGAPLTLALARAKLDEFRIPRDHPMIPVAPRQRVGLGYIEVEFLQVAHSVTDAMGLVIRTLAGTIVHSGDFKIDTTAFRSEGILDALDYTDLASKDERCRMHAKVLRQAER